MGALVLTVTPAGVVVPSVIRTAVVGAIPGMGVGCAVMVAV